jgi:hypothetical protein
VYRDDVFGGKVYEPTAAQLVAVGLPPVLPPPTQVGGDGDGAAGAAAAAAAAAVAGGGGAPARDDKTLLSASGEGAATSLDFAPLDMSGSGSGSAAVVVETGASAAAPAPAPAPAPEPAPAPAPGAAPAWAPITPWRRKLVLALLGVLPIALLVADRWVGLSWMTLLAGAVLCVADGGRPEPLLARVDAQLLLFFSGLFVAVAGFSATGVPQLVWDALLPYVSVRSAAGVAVFSVVVVAGSNTVSNVPLTLILAPFLQAMPVQADAPLAWLLLAWVSTVAGNLTLLGSVANLIVAERAKDVHPMRFLPYLAIGAPSTALMCIVGTPLVWACASAVV